jgi:adenine-specific DNA-methyltransferase
MARKRLLLVENVRPFVVQNLGKYERQVWQQAEFGKNSGRIIQAYREFVLDVYGAKSMNGHTWLHGVKNGRHVHVGAVDSPVTSADVRNIAIELAQTSPDGAKRGIDILGWDFAFELNEVAREEGKRANVDIHFWRIPREILDKRAVEQGDVRFFELAALAVSTQVDGKTATIKIDDFVIPADDVPSEVQEAITHWSMWIDYWAVDWNNHDDTFHNEWQAFRTSATPVLTTEATNEYAESATYKVAVKVIDILGNDTTKTIELTV